MKTIVRMRFGSHLYGTDTPQSDLDYKSVYMPPSRDILLQRIQGTISSKRPKAEGEKNYAGEIDEEAYALHRFLQLAADGQTVALDMLFAPASMIETTTYLWQEIQAQRQIFLNRKSASFVGYCRTQANKYGIKGSRVAAAREAVELFRRGRHEYGADSSIDHMVAEIEAFCASHEHCQVVELHTASRDSGALLKHFECCNKKVPFTNSIKSGFELYSRIYDQYGHRARMAETNEGIDWKALSHAVRVGWEALELLHTGRITFPLPNAMHIRQIKCGALPYDEVAAEIEALLERVELASRSSSLPDQPNLEAIDDLVEWAYRSRVVSAND